MAEIRSFIVVVTFISLFGILLGFVPAGMVTSTPLGEIPSTFDIDASILSGYKETVGYNCNSTTFGTPYGWGDSYQYALDGTNYLMLSYTNYPLFKLGTKTMVGIFWFGGVEWGTWRLIGGSGSYGDTLTVAQLQDAYNQTGLPVRFRVSTPRVQSDIWFSWNSTLYANASLAAENDGLWVLHGVGNGNETGTNALALVLSILTFRAPNISPALNAMIAIPIYACIAMLLLIIYEKVKLF